MMTLREGPQIKGHNYTKKNYEINCTLRVLYVFTRRSQSIQGSLFFVKFLFFSLLLYQFF